jgi:Cys/Met metabolism PLP-dependent enzyme
MSHGNQCGPSLLWRSAPADTVGHTRAIPVKTCLRSTERKVHGYEAPRCVKVATLAVSLGGVETLIEHPASMTHASMSAADRRAAGFSDGLVRYSVGIEDVEDLIADLRQALDAISAATPELRLSRSATTVA